MNWSITDFEKLRKKAFVQIAFVTKERTGLKDLPVQEHLLKAEIHRFIEIQQKFNALPSEITTV